MRSVRTSLRLSPLPLAIAVACAVSPPPALALSPHPGWQNPVSGGPVRSFDPGRHAFAAGAHRGVDLAARPGQPVRTACSGRVAFAGVVAGRPVVTVACGSWRVTHLPVVRPLVAAGEHVGLGRRLGSVGHDESHAGLHLGVRRADRSFGYVDPWLLLSGAGTGDRPEAIPVSRRRPLPRVGFRAPRPVDVRVPRSVPVAQPHGARRLAPPLAWIGLALMLAGCLGAGGLASRRRAAQAPAARRTGVGPALTGHVRSRTGEDCRPR